MKDINETAYSHYAGDDYATLSSSEKRIINKINSLKKKFPDEVDIRYVNPDGSILCDIPWDWLKIKPKVKRTMTDEQREIAKQRATEIRKIKQEKNAENT